MELRKTNERWDRTFDAEGAESGNRLESVQFNVKDDEGNVIGNAHIGQMGGNVHINFPAGGNARIDINGYVTIEKGEEMLKAVMGIEE